MWIEFFGRRKWIPDENWRSCLSNSLIKGADTKPVQTVDALGFLWDIDDSLPDDRAYIFDSSWWIIDGEIMVKKDIILSPKNYNRILLKMLKWLKTDKNNDYYRKCIEADKVLCYKCRNPVDGDAVSIRPVSNTNPNGVRRYYDKACFDQLYH